MKTVEYREQPKEDDFGWGSIQAESDTSTTSEKEMELMAEQIVVLRKKLDSVDKMITPLFKTLMKDPEKPMIKWPDRLEILESRLEEFKELCKVTIPRSS
jgi:hypothetical protein